MFTGLVDACAVVLKAQKGGPLLRLVLRVPAAYAKVSVGSSVCVDGCCLTVVGRKKNELSFDLIPETLDRTYFRSIAIGDRVNLERPLRWGGRVEGHLVQGHVDGTVTLVERLVKGRSQSLRFRIAKKMSKWVVEKGSATINGVSLTAGKKSQGAFWVHLVPHTLKRTNLAVLKVGEKANFEADWAVKAGRER